VNESQPTASSQLPFLPSNSHKACSDSHAASVISHMASVVSRCICTTVDTRACTRSGRHVTCSAHLGRAQQPRCPYQQTHWRGDAAGSPGSSACTAQIQGGSQVPASVQTNTHVCSSAGEAILPVVAVVEGSANQRG